MYASNGFSRRRPSGWAERRRYFRRLLAKTRAQAEARAKEKAVTAAK